MSGKIMTVLGPVQPEDVGLTLPHEHLSMSFLSIKQPSPAHIPNADKIFSQPFHMSNLGYIRQYPLSYPANLTLDKNAVRQDVISFKAAGGDCMVENSVTGLQRDFSFVLDIAKETGVKIVAGTGFYVDPFQTPETRAMTSEKLADFMTEELTVGISGTSHKAGVIGEVGCSWPITNFEKASLKASAAVQDALGVPVIVHPGRHRDSAFEAMRILAEAGGDPSRTIMSHLDRTLLRDGEILEFADIGCICEYDLFGIEVSMYQLADIDMPHDGERIRRIKLLIENGFQDNIVIAHDMHTNHRLQYFGGHGYTHIIHNVVPMMRSRGISQDNIDKMLIHTPRRWLTIK